MDFIDLKAQQKLIKKSLDKAIQNVMAHGCYVMGPEVYQLEKTLSEYVDSKNCISVSNGTMALLLALIALDIKPGDEIITTPFSFIAPVEVIVLLKAKPVFVDINPKTFNLDPKNLEAAITDKTKAIISVNLFGQPSNFSAINEITEKYNIPVIEDAAQSFGATHNGKKSCNLTKIACTSFFPAKPLGCYGEGGACFTNDQDIAEKLRLLRNHGQSDRYTHKVLGVNARLETLQAAILLEKFKIFENELKQRQEVAEHYESRLKDYVEVPHIEDFNSSSYAQYTIKVDDRDNLKKALEEKQIPTAIHYPFPIHFQPAYRYLNYKEGDFPIAEVISKKVLSLPMHPYLASKTIDEIANHILNFFKK